LEVLPATCPAIPAKSSSSTKAAAGAASIPASKTQPNTAAADAGTCDTPAPGSDQDIPYSPTAEGAAPAAAAASVPTHNTTPDATATAAAAAAVQSDDDVAEPQQWLGIRRTLRGDTSRTHIKRPDSNSWTPVNQVCMRCTVPLYRLLQQKL
jgi:hypothetical protein